jgi:hypothetical protein
VCFCSYYWKLRFFGIVLLIEWVIAHFYVVPIQIELFCSVWIEWMSDCHWRSQKGFEGGD